MSDALEELRNRYAALETDELFAIVHTDSHQYRSEAIRVAQEELARRNISSDDAAKLQQKAETKRKERLDEEGIGLSVGLKILCLLLPGIPALITYAVMEIKGRKRAAREAIVWFCIGIVTWFVLSLCFGGFYTNDLHAASAA